MEQLVKWDVKNMSKLKSLKKKTINLEEIEKIFKIREYKKLCDLVNDLIEKKEINPIKNSGGNGKTPKLYKRYRVVKEKKDYSDFLEELSFRVSTRFDISYYKNHLDKYEKHREYILQLSMI